MTETRSRSLSIVDVVRLIAVVVLIVAALIWMIWVANESVEENAIGTVSSGCVVADTGSCPITTTEVSRFGWTPSFPWLQFRQEEVEEIHAAGGVQPFVRVKQPELLKSESLDRALRDIQITGLAEAARRANIPAEVANALGDKQVIKPATIEILPDMGEGGSLRLTGRTVSGLSADYLYTGAFSSIDIRASCSHEHMEGTCRFNLRRTDEGYDLSVVLPEAARQLDPLNDPSAEASTGELEACSNTSRTTAEGKERDPEVVVHILASQAQRWRHGVKLEKQAALAQLALNDVPSVRFSLKVRWIDADINRMARELEVRLGDVKNPLVDPCSSQPDKPLVGAAETACTDWKGLRRELNATNVLEKRVNLYLLVAYSAPTNGVTRRTLNDCGRASRLIADPSVNRDFAVVDGACEGMIIAHELGHLLGLQHQLDADPHLGFVIKGASSEKDENYPSHPLWPKNRPVLHSHLKERGKKVGTIMGVSVDYRLPAFTRSNATCSGYALSAPSRIPGTDDVQVVREIVLEFVLRGRVPPSPFPARNPASCRSIPHEKVACVDAGVAIKTFTPGGYAVPHLVQPPQMQPTDTALLLSAFTDESGDPESNRLLSTRRLNNVRAKLATSLPVIQCIYGEEARPAQLCDLSDEEARTRPELRGVYAMGLAQPQ